MKNKTAFLLCLVLALTLIFSGCASGDGGGADTEDPAKAPNDGAVSVTVAGLKGPTSIGMIQMISEDALNGDGYDVEYMVAEAPDVLTGKLINGEIQIAALPTNTAAILFNKTEGDIQFLAQNTLGILYAVGREEIGSIADLAGKDVISSGSGAVPQYAIDYILAQNGLSDSVTVDYYPDHATAAQVILAGDADVAILPQPFVTQVTMKDDSVKILLDITEEWDKASKGESALSMGCLVVNKDFAKTHPDFIRQFLSLYKESVDFVNGNPKEAAELVAAEGIIDSAPLVEAAIPYCNIVYADAQSVKDEMNGFFKTLFDFDPASVGGALPDDSFYYSE